MQTLLVVVSLGEGQRVQLVPPSMTNFSALQDRPTVPHTPHPCMCIDSTLGHANTHSHTHTHTHTFTCAHHTTVRMSALLTFSTLLQGVAVPKLLLVFFSRTHACTCKTNTHKCAHKLNPFPAQVKDPRKSMAGTGSEGTWMAQVTHHCDKFLQSRIWNCRVGIPESTATRATLVLIKFWHQKNVCV